MFAIPEVGPTGYGDSSDWCCLNKRRPHGKRGQLTEMLAKLCILLCGDSPWVAWRGLASKLDLEEYEGSSSAWVWGMVTTEREKVECLVPVDGTASD